MNHTKKFNSKPYSSFTPKEKNKILNNNFKSIYKFVTENCNDYKLLTKDIEAIKNKYAFNVNFIFFENMKNYSVGGTVVENFNHTLETLINLEKENKEISDMLVKSRDIYKSILKVTDNKANFEVITFGNTLQLINNSLSFPSNLFDSLTADFLKKNINYIKENSKEPTIKANADKLKLSLLYEDNKSTQEGLTLIRDFTFEKRNELSEFIAYVTEKIYKIEKMIQDKINYIGSKKHLMNFMEQNDVLLFNQKCELITL